MGNGLEIECLHFEQFWPILVLLCNDVARLALQWTHTLPIVVRYLKKYYKQ